jgi:uncharacterized membrane protein
MMLKPIRTLLRIFVTGALAALPLAATVLIFAWAAGTLIKWLGPGSMVGGVLRSIGLGVGASEVVGYAIGVGIVAAAIFGLGLLAEAGLQRGFAGAVNGLLVRIPVVGTVYDVLKRLVALIRTNDGQGDRLKSMSVVWCHFGGPQPEGNSAALALLSSDVPVLVDGRRCLAVLIPTAPVPVGGGLIYVPEHWVTRADVGVEAVTSIYVSMGLTSPQYLPNVDHPRSGVAAPPQGGAASGPAKPDPRRLLG